MFTCTGDKLKEKECKSVIVSCGVTGIEKIINKSEFIFSNNRFNVSMTREKAKTFIFIFGCECGTNLATNIKASNDSTHKEGLDYI